MSDPKHPDADSAKPVLFILLAVAGALAVTIAVALVFFFRVQHATVKPQTKTRGERFPPGQDFSRANSVTILLGDKPILQGVAHIDDEPDGATTVETVNGVSARVQRLAGTRTQLYFYFQIHPSFKQEDLRGARIDVEYLAPEAGTLGVHYDALDAEDVSNARYREALSAVRLEGSSTWQTATFHTRGDAMFANRQNGQADFRVYAKAPILYLRRVTLTREAVKGEGWSGDLSASNQVSIALGDEKPGDGLRHRADEPDGRTQVGNLDGVTCRHLNRAPKNGFFYFALSPSFKQNGLKNARVDIEYFVNRPTFFRLQFDGMKGETPHKYVTVLPERAPVARFGGNVEFGRATTIGSWSVATFQISNAVFRNGQNGDSDFRIEVSPGEMYIRRVTITREDLASAPTTLTQ